MMNILTKGFDFEIVKLYYQKILYLLTLFIYSFIIFVFYYTIFDLEITLLIIH